VLCVCECGLFARESADCSSNAYVDRASCMVAVGLALQVHVQVALAVWHLLAGLIGRAKAC